MAGISEDRDRQVVPRWRSFDATLRHGELAPLRAPESRTEAVEAFDELQTDWRERRGISTAADLVSAAFVIGRESDTVEAARYLLQQDKTPAGARSIAALVLQKVGETVLTSEKDHSQ